MGGWIVGWCTLVMHACSRMIIDSHSYNAGEGGGEGEGVYSESARRRSVAMDPLRKAAGVTWLPRPIFRI